MLYISNTVQVVLESIWRKFNTNLLHRLWTHTNYITYYKVFPCGSSNVLLQSGPVRSQTCFQILLEKITNILSLQIVRNNNAALFFSGSATADSNQQALRSHMFGFLWSSVYAWFTLSDQKWSESLSYFLAKICKKNNFGLFCWISAQPEQLWTDRKKKLTWVNLL